MVRAAVPLGVILAMRWKALGIEKCLP